MTADLFAGTASPPMPLAEGATLLPGFALGAAADCLAAIAEVTARAPFRHMLTPGGLAMSAAMSNCGALGWVSDKRGYRYSATDPVSNRPWPVMPQSLRRLAADAAGEAGFPDFVPDCCLINRYQPGARMALHRDLDEGDLSAPIVSFSLGLPIVFLFGGLSRKERPRRLALAHGDAVVWGGPARLRFHGVAPLQDGLHPLTGGLRFNLTLRRAGPP